VRAALPLHFALAHEFQIRLADQRRCLVDADAPLARHMTGGDDVKLVDTVVSDIVHALTDAAA